MYFNLFRRFRQAYGSSDSCTSFIQRNMEVKNINILLQLASHKGINLLCINTWTLCAVSLLACMQDLIYWLKLKWYFDIFWASVLQKKNLFVQAHLTMFCCHEQFINRAYFSVVWNMPIAIHFRFIFNFHHYIVWS